MVFRKSLYIYGISYDGAINKPLFSGCLYIYILLAIAARKVFMNQTIQGIPLVYVCNVRLCCKNGFDRFLNCIKSDVPHWGYWCDGKKIIIVNYRPIKNT